MAKQGKNTNYLDVHPKPCRNFQSKGTCRFKGGCAYQHVQQEQGENIFLVQILASHFKEVLELRQEVNDLKVTLENIQNQMITTNSNSDAGDKETRNKTESSTTEAESTKVQYKCDVCEYQSEKEITLNKHKNTKHLNLNKKKRNISVSTQEKS